jgi:hypothetical protein
LLDRLTERLGLEPGQSIVEVAVALPFLILIVVGLVEMGILLASYLSLVNAAREGAIFASMHPELVDTATCQPDNTPNAYPLPEGTPGYCTGIHDDDPFGGTTTSTTVWSEYYNRVSNEVFVVLGETLKSGGLLDQDYLTVDRPIPSAPVQPYCPTGLEAGCAITVTVHYRLHTLTSDISMPAFGRFGLPNTYQINYSVAVPIR